MQDALEAEFSLKIRIYYALSRYMKTKRVSFEGKTYDDIERDVTIEIVDIS